MFETKDRRLSHWETAYQAQSVDESIEKIIRVPTFFSTCVDLDQDLERFSPQISYDPIKTISNLKEQIWHSTLLLMKDQESDLVTGWMQ